MVKLEQYVPKCYKDIRELKAIYEVEDTQLSGTESSIVQVFNNYFVQHCDLTTIKDWEQALQIISSASEDVEQRRQKVIIKLSSTAPFTEIYLRNLLDTYTKDSKVNIDSVNNEVEIVITENNVDMVNFLHSILISIIPVHISFNVIIGLEYDVKRKEYIGTTTSVSNIYHVGRR